MKVDRERIGKILNSQMSAMFATFRELQIPDEILDSIVAGDKKGLDNATQYLRAADMEMRDRTVRANCISWAINTVGLAAELGLGLEKNETEQGELPRIVKEKPKELN